MRMLFTHKVILEKCVGKDEYHRPIYQAPVTIPAIVDDASKTFRNRPNEETEYTARVLLPNNYEPQPDDRITFNGNTNFIRFVSCAHDYRRDIVHYYNVYFGKQKPREDMK